MGLVVSFLMICVDICIFPLLSGFLVETEGSDLSRKVRGTEGVNLALVWSKSDLMAPSYGQKTVLQFTSIKLTSIKV